MRQIFSWDVYSMVCCNTVLYVYWDFMKLVPHQVIVFEILLIRLVVRSEVTQARTKFQHSKKIYLYCFFFVVVFFNNAVVVGGWYHPILHFTKKMHKLRCPKQGGDGGDGYNECRVMHHQALKPLTAQTKIRRFCQMANFTKAILTHEVAILFCIFHEFAWFQFVTLLVLELWDKILYLDLKNI